MGKLRKSALSLLVLLVLLCGACWFYADRILNDLLRPALEQVTARALDGRVSIERLSWSDSGLDIWGVQLSRPDGIALRIPQLETEFSLPALFQRRLRTVRVIQPRFEYISTPPQTSNLQPPRNLSLELPLTIETLELSGGEVLLGLEGRSLRLRNIAFLGGLSPDFPFQLDLALGPDDGHPLSIAGRALLGPGFALALERVDFQHRALISEPLTLALTGGGLERGEASLQLAQLDQRRLRELLSLFAVRYPLPESVQFSLRDLRIGLKLEGKETSIALKVEAGEVRQGDLRLPFGLSQLLLIENATGWSSRGEIGGPADTLLNFSTSPAPQRDSIISFSAELLQAGRPLLKADGSLQQFQFRLAPLDLARLRAVFGVDSVPPPLSSLTGLTASGVATAGADSGWKLKGEFAAEESMLAEIGLSKISGRLQLQVDPEQVKIQQFTLSGALAKGAELSGRIAAQVSGVISAGQVRATLQQVKLDQIAYLSEDGQTGLGGGYLALSGSVRGNAPGGPFLIDLSGTGGAAELLAGSFYADLAAYTARLKFRGEFAAESQNLSLNALQLEFPQLGILKLSGEVSAAEVALRGGLELPDLAKSYGNRLGPLLVESFPRLAGLTLEGGLAVVGDFYWQPRSWQLIGGLQPRGLDAYWEEHQLELVAGNGRIPFNLVQGEAVAVTAASAEQSGELSFSALSVGLASLAAGRLQLAAAPNEIAFRSPLRLKLAGGEVVVTDLDLGVNATGPYGSVRINIDAVDLAQLAQELKLPPLQGSFTGDLGLIRYADRQLSTAGTASFDIFGGHVLLQNMHYQAPFSQYPIFFADIDFSGIDLLQATRTFEFGEMNGIVDGQIHGLRLFGTTPSAFSARFETRSSAKRNISVKALNNLTIISQGGLSAALSRGVYRFIDFYRYEKIGFACRLENDTFTLSGTARSDSTKYLVAGSLLPPRIDITTTTPTISFKEMLKRLKRIDRTGR